jgi:hypothetical protein
MTTDDFNFVVDAVLWIADNGVKLLPLYEPNPETGMWRCKLVGYGTPNAVQCGDNNSR